MPGGDVTPFWFNNLSLQWRQTPLVVAGVTGHGPLFVLERFAWDYGMRVIVRAEHRRASNKSMAHELSGPDRWISRMAGLATSGDWTKSMGIALTQCTLDPCAPATLTLTEPSIFSGVENSDDVEPLLSWLIGPGSGLSKVPARG
jgi:hypothetical protein